MATLAVQQVVQTGLNPAMAAASAGGDKVPPGDNVWIRVDNGGVGSINVTIDSQVPSNYGTDVDLVVAVPNGQSRLIGPIGPTRFTDPTTGLANISYSGVGTVTVGAFKV